MCEGVEKNIFSRAIEPKKNQDDKGWRNFKTGLEEYYGREVSIRFVTSGTGEDLSYCWAAWGWANVIVYNDNKFSNANNSNGLQNRISNLNAGVRFGTGDAEILKAEMLDKNGNPKKVFQPGEEVRIRVYTKLNKSIESGFNVGFTIRNKFTDVYLTNAYWLGYDLGKRNKDEIFVVDFIQNLNLGAGLYHLSPASAISYSHNDAVILDWINDILTFEVTSNKRFGGVVNLDTKIEIKSQEL
jgi:hypothetical protein